MSVADFSLYNNFFTPVLILDGTGKIAFKNIQFTKIFGGIKNLEKFSKYF